LKIILQTIPALIIQMLETRRTKRSVHGPARTEIAFVERAAESSFAGDDFGRSHSRGQKIFE
jgi:hypothetical protein